MPFISLPSLIAMDRTFSTMLNSNDESRHPCLAPGLLRKKVSSTLPLKMILVVGFS